MKKVLIGCVIFIGFTVTLFIIARVTGAIQFYSVPTRANAPAILLNDKLLVSNLQQPKKFDFIAFESNRQVGFDTTKMYTFVYRLIGLPGEDLQIRHGVTYIDGENIDKNLNLSHQHKVSAVYAASISAIDFEPVTTDSGYLDVPDNEALKMRAEKLIMTDVYPETQQYFGHSWTVDSFGPLKIPPGFYFVMGDNRHSASDSRLIGLIPIKQWKGTVLNKR